MWPLNHNPKFLILIFLHVYPCFFHVCRKGLSHVLYVHIGSRTRLYRNHPNNSCFLWCSQMEIHIGYYRRAVLTYWWLIVHTAFVIYSIFSLTSAPILNYTNSIDEWVVLVATQFLFAIKPKLCMCVSVHVCMSVHLSQSCQLLSAILNQFDGTHNTHMRTVITWSVT